MALILILGRPGAGKSYTALSRYVLPALKRGRRVLHNIGGLDLVGSVSFGAKPLFPSVAIDDDGHIQFTTMEDKKVNRDVVDAHGEITIIEYVERVESDNPKFARAGDLIIIDEFYLVAQDAKANLSGRVKDNWLENLQAFLRAHRHYVNDKTGHGTDVIIMAQSDHDIPAGIRQLAEKTHICKTAVLSSGFAKMVHKGITGKATGNKLRRLDFDGFRKVQGASAGNAVMVSEYFPTDDIFKHYSSYTGKAVVEQNRGFSAAAIIRLPLIMFAVCISLFVYLFPAFLDVLGFSDNNKDTAIVDAVASASPAVIVYKDVCHLEIDNICKNIGKVVVK